MTRVTSLDLLRGIAALAVAIPHFFVYDTDASGILETISVVAVEVFFVLSGFVLAPQIMYCLRRRQFATLLQFLARRWMRTISPYLVSLIVVSALFGELLSPDFWRYFFYIQNLWRQSNSNDYFSIAWSLSVEEWFYLCFPLFLSIFARIFRRDDISRQIALSLGAIALIAVLRVVYGDFDNWGQEVRRVVAFRINSIIYGFLLFALMEKIELRQSAAMLFVLFALSAVGCFKVADLTLNPDGSGAKHAFPFVAAIFGIMAIVFFRALNPAIERVALVRHVSLYLGKVSYTIYLFHLVVIYLVRDIGSVLSLPLRFLVYMVTLMTFVSLFYYFFERPILAARPRLR